MQGFWGSGNKRSICGKNGSLISGGDSGQERVSKRVTSNSQSWEGRAPGLALASVLLGKRAQFQSRSEGPGKTRHSAKGQIIRIAELSGKNSTTGRGNKRGEDQVYLARRREKKAGP